MPLSHRSPKLCPQTDISEKSLMEVVAAAALNFQTLLRQESIIFPSFYGLLNLLFFFLYSRNNVHGLGVFLWFSKCLRFNLASFTQKNIIASYTPSQ